jgi:putative transposase
LNKVPPLRCVIIVWPITANRKEGIPMYKNNIQGNGRKWKVKVMERRKWVRGLPDKWEDKSVEIALIKELIPLGLRAVEEKLAKEVDEIAGLRYKRFGGKRIHRWGRQWGSVYLHGQKVPVIVPRIRIKGRMTEGELNLKTYDEFQKPHEYDQDVMLRLLNGISTHRYKESIGLVPQVFGISPSSVSKRFTRKAEEALREIQSRRLEEHDIVSVIMDGKRFGKDGIVIALGVTIHGDKVILGIEQMHNENSLSTTQFINKLIERGLKYTDGILFVIDGSKGIIKAVKDAFNEYAFIQRCEYHKRENITSYLNDRDAEHFKDELNSAYNAPDYSSAKEKLNRVYCQLKKINMSSAESLLEGLEETLTLQRLGLRGAIGKSLSTTNCIESIMSQLGQYTDKVDRWRDSGHIQRWVAASLWQIEPRLRKIRGYKYLKLLRLRMKEEIAKKQNTQQNKTVIGINTQKELLMAEV